jgi:hypothetical protein
MQDNQPQQEHNNFGWENNEHTIEYPPYYYTDSKDPIPKDIKKKKKQLWRYIAEDMKKDNIHSNEVQWLTFTTTFAVSKKQFEKTLLNDLGVEIKHLVESYLDNALNGSAIKYTNISKIKGFTYNNWWEDDDMNEQMTKQLENIDKICNNEVSDTDE